MSHTGLSKQLSRTLHVSTKEVVSRNKLGKTNVWFILETLTFYICENMGCQEFRHLTFRMIEKSAKDQY
uniref:Uncharacterized protein n=1 Tax=Arion vulgaris TaxID=1028688 RepID=A0A0B7ADR1_9EUPU